ncbi:hypothetical protein AGMMS50239_32950 [Bacteroidia bacterium]|nr:hypothetical protein AGMMS50239_32950 [Bacteroidia bacterium]
MSSNRKLDVKAIVSVDGEKVNYVSLKISQAMGEHHDFELLLDHKTFDTLFFKSPDKQLTLIHSKVICDLQHGDDSGKAYVFSGLVTNVRMIAQDGHHGGVLLAGKSKTIELERGEMMQTYSNTNLKLILEEVTGSTLSLDADIKPAWKSDIDFAIQCGESDWHFLRRLCRQYNERYFYTGLDLYVGPYPEFPVVPLKYDLELRSLEIGSRLVSNTFSTYYYKRDDHTTLKQDSPPDIEGATGWLQQISGRADRLNMGRKPNVPVSACVPDMGSLIDVVKAQKVSAGSEMLYIRGECKTCDVNIGRLVDVTFPKNMGGAGMGLYRVYKVCHHFEQNGKYTCTFEAVPADLESLYMPEVSIPTPYPIEAEIYDNDDPKGLGRVKVKFPFDKRQCDAWIPVMSLDAGGNGLGKGPASRGFTFIPELKDSVLVSFLNPQQLAQPYVTGSMFHGGNAVNLGGGKGNHIKTILTRSEHLVEFNDDEKGHWGITIKDKDGNVVNLDTKGKNINITAPETVTITAKNVVINAEENISSSAGNNISESAGDSITEIAGRDIIQSAKKNILETADNKTEMVKKDYTRSSKKSDVYAKEINMTSSKENMLLQSAKTVKINSNEKTNLF